MRQLIPPLIVVVLVSSPAMQAADLTVDTNTTVSGILWATGTNDVIDVDIVDGSSPPTVVDIVEDAIVQVLFHIRDSSVVNVFGGNVYRGGFVWAYDTCEVNISGGSVSCGLRAFDSSTVSMSSGGLGGGALGNSVYTHDSSTLNVSGGRARNQLYAYDSSVIDISGGYVRQLYSYDSARITISGGEMDYFSAGGSSTVNLSGGELRSAIPLLASGSATINIFGTGFNYPRGPIPDRWGDLSGILANGDPINCGFTIGRDASIFIVPEPSSLWSTAIAALAGSLMYALRRRKPRR